MTKNYPAGRHFRPIPMKTVFSTLALLILLGAVAAWTTPKNRSFTFSGKVTDETGKGLIGATVLVKGDKLGTVTDVEGHFTLDAPDSCLTLIINYIGYFQKELENTCAGDELVIAMEPAAVLDEVVVTGYGTEKRSEGRTAGIARNASKALAKRDRAGAFDYNRLPPPPPPPRQPHSQTQRSPHQPHAQKSAPLRGHRTVR